MGHRYNSPLRHLDVGVLIVQDLEIILRGIGGILYHRKLGGNVRKGNFGNPLVHIGVIIDYKAISYFGTPENTQGRAIQAALKRSTLSHPRLEQAIQYE